MPYASDAQRRYFNANRAELESQGVDVDEWNDSSRGKKLPEKVGDKDKKKTKQSFDTIRRWLGLGGGQKIDNTAALATGGAAGAMAGGAAAMRQRPQANAPKPEPAWTGPDWAEEQYRDPARFEFIPHQWDMPGGQRSGRLVDKQTGQVVQAHDDVNAQQQWLNQMFNKKAPGKPASTAPPASPPAQAPPSTPGAAPKNPAHGSYQSQMQRGLDSGFFADPGAAKAEMQAAEKAQGGGMDKQNSSDFTPEQWEREEDEQEAHAKSMGLTYKRTKIPKGHKAVRGKIVKDALSRLPEPNAGEISSVARRLVVSRITQPNRCTKEAALAVLSRLTAPTAQKTASNSVLEGIIEPSESPESPHSSVGAHSESRPVSTEPLYYTKVAIAAMRKDRLLVGPQLRSWRKNRSDILKQAVALAPQGAAVGPAADAVSMLRGATGPDPMAAMAQNPLMRQGSQVGAPGGATSPAQNPINMYGPLNNADQVGGGMFGQKNTEGGSLKLAGTQLMTKLAALSPLRMGDLTITDRENLGLDIYNRMTGQKVSFFTQGGELGLMEWLSEKYPKGRQSGNVALGHKLAGTKLKEKLAMPNLLGGRKKKKKEDTRRPGLLPWLATGIGAGAMGTAYGIGSDKAINNAVAGFKTMDQPLGPNDTMLSRYAGAMSGAANLSPFGMPISELMPAIRSQPWIMGKKPLAPESGKDSGGAWQAIAGGLGEKNPVTQFMRKGIGIPDYTADTPELFHGARAHYGQFARGPIAAVSHMMSGPRRGYGLQSPELTAGGAKTYKDYFAPKFEEFVIQRTGMLPNEIDTKYMPTEEQTKLLQDFHASLSPAEQAEKSRIETQEMEGLKSQNTSNYRPIVEGAAKARQKLKDIGFTAGGAGLGGLAGHGLYRALTDDDEESWLGNTLSTGAGMGLGGLAGYFGGTEAGRQQVSNLLSSLAQKFGKQSNHIDWAEKLAMQPQAPPPAPAPQGAAPPPPPPQPQQGAASATTGRSMAQINRQLAQSPKQKQQPAPPAPAQPAAA